MEISNLEIQQKALEFLSSGTTPRDDKFQFLKAIVKILDAEQLKTVKLWATKERRKIFEEVINPATTVITPSSGVILGPPTPWWCKWSLDKIRAFDCEHVHVTANYGYDKIKAGSVSVVDFYGNQVYFSKCYREPGSFNTHPLMINVNGFHRNSLDWNQKYVKDPDIVKTDLQKEFIGKLLITHAGQVDFDSLGLSSGDYLNDHSWFDLQDYFKT